MRPKLLQICNSNIIGYIFSDRTDMNAAIATGSPIATVTGVGMTSKDVQPKSPGVNDEDDDEGTHYFFQIRIIVIQK